MASIVKEGGGILINFAKKNDDVRRILLKEKKKGTNLTDYICESIRFYVNNSNNVVLDKNITELVRKEVEKQLANINLANINLNKNDESIDLEDDLDFIDVDED